MAAPPRAPASTPGPARRGSGRTLRGCVKRLSSCGEALIDHHWNPATIGIGITLHDGL